uniref:Uncharacterized protein n=1 Tax=Anopheles funestus TaxID=62324 RepID=A0A4Y0BIH0_ANOFN
MKQSQRARCAPLRIVPNGSLTSTFLVGHESGILITCPSHLILPALITVRISAPPNSSASSSSALLVHTAKNSLFENSECIGVLR